MNTRFSLGIDLGTSNSVIALADLQTGQAEVLKVTQILVEKGPVLKRFTARAKGRGNRIVKPTCHIFVTVGDGRN